MDQNFLPGERQWIFPPPPFLGRSSQPAIAATGSSTEGQALNLPGPSGNNTDAQQSQETSEDVGSKSGKQRTRKRRRSVVGIKEEAPALPSMPWEDETRATMGLSEDEFSEFINSQGFMNKSSDLQSLIDFGVPEPKGMPKFARKVPENFYKYSNALRVYRNSLRASAVDGEIIKNACDQAFTYPDRGAEALPPADRQEKLSPVEMIITVDLYHPSGSVRNRITSELKTSSMPVLAMTVDILASQTLNDLRSKLLCENDFVYICPIKHPKDVKKMDWRKFAGAHDEATTCSAAIFINDTIYTAEVTPNYGQVIRRWIHQPLLENKSNLKCGTLDTKIKDIVFKPGYPYLYRHSDCEHLLVFTNVRRPHPTDPQVPKLYPRFSYIHNLPAIPCRVNPKHLAKFVVKNDRRLPEKVVPLCKECVMGFCFTTDINSKDIPFGEFQLYPLVQLQTLPLNDGT